jgi:membrane protein YqaA with SNARE-associated domain
MGGMSSVFLWVRKLYDWVLHWAETPYGGWALLALAFCESSFFPVPPDVLLIALAISIPKRAFFYALLCAVGSVAGGVFGYFIGREFIELIGLPIVRFYGAMDHYHSIQILYQKYDAWAVGIAGFTPIPYKVFTISAGAFKIDFLVFLIASTVSRSARFFLVASLIYFFGPPIRTFIDRYFELLATVFAILLVLGFVALKWIF